MTGVGLLGAEHRDRGRQRPAAGERRHRLEELPLLGAEQLVAPVQRGVDGLLAKRRGAAAAGQDARRGVQLVRDLLDGQHVDPGGRQLQRQRDTLHAAAHPADLAQPVVARVDAVRGGAGEEHADGVGVADLVDGGPRRRHRQRLHLPDHLAGGAQQLAAGGDERQPRAALQQDGAQPGAGLDDVFAVVQDHQQLARADVLGQRVDLGGVGGRAQPDGGRDRVDDLRAVRAGRQRHPARAGLELAAHLVGDRDREPGLADAAQAGQRHQPDAAVAEQRRQLGQLGLAADEGVGRQRRPLDLWRVARRGPAQRLGELGEVGVGQVQRGGQQPHRQRPGRAPAAALQRGDGVGAETGLLRKLLLRQAGRQPMPPEQTREVVDLVAGRHALFTSEMTR